MFVHTENKRQTIRSLIKMRKTKLIGISGVARAGKNYFADHLMQFLKSKGYTSRDFALAHELKLDLRDICINKLGIDTFTQNDEEKALIRPLLVAWGKIQRNKTSGTYWWKRLLDSIHERYYDFSIVTDIRYDFFEQDELYFVKNRGGYIIHITRIIGPNGEIQPPPNQDEAENDPKIKEKADLKFIFPNLLTMNEQERTSVLDEACEKVLNLYVN